MHTFAYILSRLFIAKCKAQSNPFFGSLKIYANACIYIYLRDADDYE